MAITAEQERKRYEDYMRGKDATREKAQEAQRYYQTNILGTDLTPNDGRGTVEEAPTEPTRPLAPDANDVAQDQINQAARMAAQQAAPTQEGGDSDSGAEKASKRRKAGSSGKRGLSVRRASGSGLNI